MVADTQNHGSGSWLDRVDLEDWDEMEQLFGVNGRDALM